MIVDGDLRTVNNLYTYLKEILKVELRYAKGDKKIKNTSNQRNGTIKKTVNTKFGTIKLDI